MPTGTPDDVALRLDALLRAGLKQAVLFPLSTDGDAKAAILRTIEFLSTKRVLKPEGCAVAPA